jgi:ATP-binding protein involved in chromosome partitioning
MQLNKEQVLQALGNVEEPDLKKDLVTLNMIQDIHIEVKLFGSVNYTGLPA